MKKMLLVALITLTIVLTGTVFAQNGNQTGPSTPTTTFDWEQLMQIVSFLLIFAGVLSRAFLPYLRKWLADEEIGFQKRYVAIIIASFITAWLAWPNFSAAFTGWWQILTASFVFGFGLQSTYTEIYAWFASAVTSQGQTQPPATTTPS